MNIQDSMNPIDDQQTAEQSEGDSGADQQPLEQERRPVNTSALLLFGLLAAVGGTTYLMCLWTGSQSIRTDPTVAAAAYTIGNFLKAGAQDQHQMSVMLRDSEKVVKQFDTYPTAHQIPLTDLKGDPFKSAADTQPSVTVSGDDAQKLLEQQQKAAQSIVQGLKLESIAWGAHSICMINGKSYSQGQGTDSFTVDQILPQGVWLRVGTQRLELTMAPPRLN